MPNRYHTLKLFTSIKRKKIVVELNKQNFELKIQAYDYCIIYLSYDTYTVTVYLLFDIPNNGMILILSAEVVSC